MWASLRCFPSPLALSMRHTRTDSEDGHHPSRCTCASKNYDRSHYCGGGLSSPSSAGGKFTAFPPVVRRLAAAVPMAQDVRADAERWRGERGGGLPLMARARSTNGRWRTGFVHGFCDFWLASAPSLSSRSSPLLRQKNGTGTCLRGFLR